VRNYVSLRLPIALVTVITSPFILTHTIGIINASSLIANDDIKKSLIAVQNATEPEPLKLTDEQIKDALTHLPGWSVVNGKIQKTFAFENFPTLFDFMFKVANLSQVISHHPNMTSTFNTLTLDYATWRIGHAISDLDINAANRVEMLYDNGNYTTK
jgi:4a-hydroxytetrahydrobiopterin dehydratase